MDFNTGTTIDNVYGVNGIVHAFTPGHYETSIKFAAYDAYGTYEGAVSSTQALQASLEKAKEDAKAMPKRGK